MDFNFTPNEESKDPLKDFGRNLTDFAAQGKLDPVIGRDEEIRRVIRILSRKTKNNPILVGEPGVGKTAIAEGLAQKIVAGDVPENLKDKEIIELDVPALIAGASYQGQFEKRLKDVMKKIKESDGNIIIFIDEIHTLIGTGKTGQGGMDAAQIIKPMLARGEMKLIGATTLDEHKKYIESDPAFERRLQKVDVVEPTEEDTLTILRGIKEKFENYHKVKITDSALVQAVKLSSRYISDRFLPDKAIDLVDEAAAGIQTQMNSRPEELERKEHKLANLEMEKAALSKEKDAKSESRLIEINTEIDGIKKDVDSLRKKWNEEKSIAEDVAKIREKIDFYRIQQQRFQAEGEYEKASVLLYKEIPSLEKKLEDVRAKAKETTLLKETVGENEIADVVSRWTGIPVSKLIQDQKDKLLSLEKHLAQRVKGQPEALEIVANTILRSRANINDPNRPLGSFIFMGPTGVGKTEVAKALASELFDSEKNLIRIDMSEYMEEHSVARLIGAPPGYVGYDAGGQLTEEVRRKPYSIVLFDEIEKAHPKVLDVLLQILDDGHITDGQGKHVNFKNTIIILTTNIGSVDIMEGKKPEEVVKQLHKYLRPEFINRIDEIIPFNSLDKKSIALIVSNELDKLINRLEEKEIVITFSKEVINKIAEDAFDPSFGARPIRRYIQKHIESDLARKIISGDIQPSIAYVCKIENEHFKYENVKMN